MPPKRGEAEAVRESGAVGEDVWVPCPPPRIEDGVWVRVSEREKHKGKKQREHRGAGRRA